MIENKKRKVVVIGNSPSYVIINSLITQFTKKQYEAIVAKANIDAFNDSVLEKPALVLVYCDEHSDKTTKTFIYVKDWCLENEVQLAIIGYKDEIEDTKTIFPKEIIWQTFARPFNVAELVNAVEEEIICGVRKKQILAVDDDGQALRTISNWLSDKYDISLAGSAAMALNYLGSHKPDLILLDYEMPLCNGPTFLRMMRAEINTGDIPVMFLTGIGDPDKIINVMDCSIAGWLLKSTPQEQLVYEIDKFFEKQKALAR